MKRKEIEALLLLRERALTINELARSLKLSYYWTSAIARLLIKKGYARKDRKIELTPTAKTALFIRLSRKYNLTTLLVDPHEEVLLTLLDPLSLALIQKKTSLAHATTYKALNTLMQIGAIKKISGQYLVSDNELKNFLLILKEEKEIAGIETYATIIYSNYFKLKKVPIGTKAQGSLTAFSLFKNYGIEYYTTYDYYIHPEKKVSIEEILIHSLLCSETKIDIAMCAVFYVKNKAIIDNTKAKKIAKELEIFQLWSDLQNYVKNIPVKFSDKFPSWKEFVEKASLYGLQIYQPLPLKTYLDIFDKIGSALEKPLRIYVFGGQNMLMRGLKAATKDIDIIVENENDFKILNSTLRAIGYSPVAEITLEDKKLSPSGIYIAEKLPRLDVFTKTIAGAFTLTEDMKKRTEPRKYNKLIVGLLSPNDIFLLKAITDREGDIEDMSILARTSNLNWKNIFRTYMEEEKLTKRHFCFTILDNIEILQEKYDVKIPFHRKLVSHCTDATIIDAVSKGCKTVKEIKKLIDFPEHHIRNRINVLAKKGEIKKKIRKKKILLQPI